MFLLLRALKGARHWFLISRQEPDDVILWLRLSEFGDDSFAVMKPHNSAHKWQKSTWFKFGLFTYQGRLLVQLWATSPAPAVFTLLCGPTTFHRGKIEEVYICVTVWGDQHWGTGSMSQRAKGSLKKENLPCQSLKAGHPEHARFFFLSQSWALCTMNMSPTLRRSAQSSTVTSRGVRSKTFSPNHWDLDQMAPWKCLSFSKSLNSIKKEKRKEKKQPCWSSLQRCPRRPSRRANFLILFNAELGLERNKCDPVVRWHNSLVYSFIVKIKSQLMVKHNTFGCLNIDL